MPPGLDHAIAECVSDVSAWLDGEKAENPFQTKSVLAVMALKDPEQWDLKALLPLADCLTTWRARRLPTRGAAPPQHLLHPQADLSLILVANRLVHALNSGKNAQKILDPQAWARGERLRLLAPLGVFTDYATHPRGLAAHSFDTETLSSFEMKGGETFGALDLPLRTLNGVVYALFLAHLLRSVSPSDKELQAVVRTLSDHTKIPAAANRTFERMVLPTVFPLLTDLSHVKNMLQWHQGLITGKMDALSDEEHEAAGTVHADLLVAVAERLTERGLSAMASPDVTALLAVAVLAVPGDGELGRSELRALIKAARFADKGAAADTEHGHDGWMCRLAGVVLHSALLRFGGFDYALDEAATAWLGLLSAPRDWAATAVQKSDLKKDIDTAAQVYLMAVIRAVQIEAEDAEAGTHRIPGGGPDHYLRYVRTLNAVMSTLPYIDRTKRDRAAEPLAYFLNAHRFIREATGFFKVSDDDDEDDGFEEACRHVRAFAADACKAGLLAVDRGAYATIQWHGEEEGSRVASAVFCVQLALREVREACALAVLAEGRGGDEGMSREAAAATALRALYLLGKLQGQWEAVRSGYYVPGRGATGNPLTPEVTQICAAYSDLHDVLGPALTPAEAPAVRWLAGIARDAGAAAAAQGLAAMEAEAQGVDPKDAAVQKARAEILAAGGGCSYLGCTELAPPKEDGRAARKYLKCSICTLSRYDSSACQAADWKSGHRKACKAIQAEREWVESGCDL